MSKKLIINADDFGLTAGVNYGILDSYLNNSLSSISLMVNVSKTAQAVELMERHRIDCVGIHVNLTLGKPVSSPKEIASLVDENGNFHKASWWVDHRAVEEELIREFDNQIGLFAKLTGRMPSHINYHHRYDFYHDYPNLFKHLVDKYDLPMRLERDSSQYPYEYAINESYFMLDNAKLEDHLYGDLVEMPCHAGFVDQELMEISSLNIQRSKDLRTINSVEFKKAYQALGYRLVGFDEVERK